MFTILGRLLRHTFAPMRHPVLSDEALNRLSSAVAFSEREHGGQIRVCVESRLPASYLRRSHDIKRIVRQRAAAQFAKLRVWDTEHNNGVLIYLQLAERSIEIVADRGLQRRVSQETWQAIVAAMVDPLRRGEQEAALKLAIEQVGQLLAQHFPPEYGRPDGNELPDRPSVE
jgi:uncharacterized membrane protein